MAPHQDTKSEPIPKLVDIFLAKGKTPSYLITGWHITNRCLASSNQVQRQIIRERGKSNTDRFTLETPRKAYWKIRM